VNVPRRLPAAVVVVAACALAPAVAPGVAWASAANALAFVVAAIGLAFAVGDGGLPSLGQGAFVGTGAYTTAAVRASRGWDPVTAAVAGIVVAAVLGLVVAAAVARLTRAFVVLATWLIAWTFILAISAFPRVLGGSAGISLGPARVHSRPLGRVITIGAVAWYEIALALAVGAAVAFVGLRRRFAPALALARSDAPAAIAAGVPVGRLRRCTLLVSAVFGGAAGALLVQVAGVADPTRYGPVLSVKLLVVVLVGGTTTVLGPVAGIASLTVIDRVSAVLAHRLGPSTPVLEPLVAGVVLIAALIVARDGLVPAARRLLRRARFANVGGDSSDEGGALAAHLPLVFEGAPVEVDDVSVRFGGLDALAEVSLGVAPGSCHAIIGPNGSGKSTLLRVLTGVVTPTAGTAPVLPGIVRVLQRLDQAGDLTARDAVVAGMEGVRPTGWLAAMTSTPQHRVDARRCDRAAERWLHVARVTASPSTSMTRLTAGDRRLVQIARAIASTPHVLLLDEPSAGMDADEEVRLRAVLATLRDAGLTVVVVEHNLRLVTDLADRVTVLAAGRVVAEGTPGEVARNPVVRSVYLGEMAEVQ
jgi:branched-chain amino acid transport system permease protein